MAAPPVGTPVVVRYGSTRIAGMVIATAGSGFSTGEPDDAPAITSNDQVHLFVFFPTAGSTGSMHNVTEGDGDGQFRRI